MKLPKVVQKGPHVITLEPGRYSWCTCGLTQKDPFCDSAHKGTDYRSHKFVIEETQEVELCGCKQTSTPPFCDGSHNSI